MTPEIKSLIDTDHLNLTEWVNENLELYFSVSSVEDVNKKISEHKIAINALEQKRASLLDTGAAETKAVGMLDAAWARAHDMFRVRVENPAGEVGLFQWVKHSKACAPLLHSGLSVETVLEKLEKRYHGV